MVKKTWLAALAACAAIPVAALAGGLVFERVDPELARHTADYARNYRLISVARHAMLLAMLGACAGLWLLACALVLRSKARAWSWLALAAFGPFGLAVIASLDDRQPAPGDAYEHLVQRLPGPGRAAWELACLFAACVLAIVAVVAWQELSIRIESALTGVATSVIVERRDASSGMAAFGEGLAMLYLFALEYLLRPLALGVAARLLARGDTARARAARPRSDGSGPRDPS